METKYRSHMLGELRISDVEENITVSGWVKKKRNLGELIFLDVRDVSGFSQVVVTSEEASVFSIANSLRNEYVVTVKGQVRERKSKNPEIPTGEIEIIASSVEIINEAKVSPMIIDDETDALEEVRMKYRYLDLRRNVNQDALKLRHKVVMNVRNFLDSNNFLEIETPLLTKATPEGARDYLVPSRVNKGKFYALPQSPQIYKNLLMLSGFDRYFQIVKCFRDEDLRADRQPEFTQIDLEMSFMEEQDVMNLMEKMFKQLMKNIMNIDIVEDFPIITYDDAMNNYGSDKPDLRYDLKLEEVKDIFKESDFKVFASAESIKALVYKNGSSNYSRKSIDELEAHAKKHHAKGLAWLKMEDELSGPIAKFLQEEEKLNLITTLNLTSGDVVFFGADSWNVACESMGHVRTKIAKDNDLIDQNKFAFAWIVDWPLFEYDEESKRYNAMHHPFTMPKDNKFDSEILELKARAYDVVLNGYEIGGGSVRINNTELQSKMFELLGLDDEEVQEKFGFYLEAYEYGAPVHSGIAFGLDRLVMILSKKESIKDVIAFPKNTSAREVMMDSPTSVDMEALQELSIKVDLYE